MLLFGRVSVGVDDEIVVGVICGLKGCSWRDVNETAGRNIVALRRILDIHRQDPAEDDERLLLKTMAMTPSLGARFVAPQIPTRVMEVRDRAELGYVSRRLARLVRPSDPLALLRSDDAKSHRNATVDEARRVCGAAAAQPRGVAIRSRFPSGSLMSHWRPASPSSSTGTPNSCDTASMSVT